MTVKSKPTGPLLNGTSIGIIATWVGIHAILAFAGPTRDFPDRVMDYSYSPNIVDSILHSVLRELWLMGNLYAMAVAGSWLCSLFGSRITRSAARTCVWFLVSVLQASMGEYTLARYAVIVGGLMICSTALFSVFQIPNWRTKLGKEKPCGRFAIIDIVIGTTLISILFTMMMKVSVTAGDDADATENYWTVMLWIWLAKPAIALLVVTAWLNQGSLASRMLFGFSGIAIGIGLMLGLSLSEADAGGGWWDYVPFYAAVIGGYTAGLFAVGIAARYSLINERFPDRPAVP